jgi:uncharacterized protein YndB with AHSA1/START domain
MTALQTSTTRVTRHFKAPRAEVYNALTSAGAIAKWRVPDGMSFKMLAFNGHPGGGFRVSLTYDLPGPAGKTTAQIDTYHGRFLELVPNERVVEIDTFETNDPALRGEMTITITLRDADGGTELVAVHEGVPPGVPPADNETGWNMALAKLAAMVERP